MKYGFLFFIWKAALAEDVEFCKALPFEKNDRQIWMEQHHGSYQTSFSEEFLLKKVEKDGNCLPCERFEKGTLPKVKCLAAQLVLNVYHKKDKIELQYLGLDRDKFDKFLQSLLANFDEIPVDLPIRPYPKDELIDCQKTTSGWLSVLALETGKFSDHYFSMRKLDFIPRKYFPSISFCSFGWDYTSDAQRAQILVHELVHSTFGILLDKKSRADECLTTYLEGLITAETFGSAIKNEYIDNCTNFPKDNFIQVPKDY